MKEINVLKTVWVFFLLVGAQSAFSELRPEPREWNGDRIPVKEGYILIRLKAGTTPVAAAAIHERALVKSVKNFSNLPGISVAQLQSGVVSAYSLQIYNSDPAVLYAEPDYMVKSMAVPNDPGFVQQWGLQNLGQVGGIPNADINAIKAWDSQVGSRDFAVAVIDTGVDYNHLDLKNNMWRNPGEIEGNGIDDDHNGYVDDVFGINAIKVGDKGNEGDPVDDGGHGTHVAGILAAQGNNGIGISGVMQKASIIACKFLQGDGSGAVSDAITCLDYLVSLTKRKDYPLTIVASNNSWGGGRYSRALYEAIQLNQEAGILFIAAASNESSDNDKAEAYPGNYGLSNIISVGTSDGNDDLALFSNFGAHSVSVLAPGVNILSTFPGGKYKVLSGTSMSTPYVTGLAGLIKASRPDADWITIKNLIMTGGQVTSGAFQNTISGRRIRAWDINGNGSLTCINKNVNAIISPKASVVTLKLGNSLPLSYLSINCEKSASTVSPVWVLPPQGVASPLPLSNQTTLAGAIVNDGVFKASFSPDRLGTYKLQFPNDNIVTVMVTP